MEQSKLATTQYEEKSVSATSGASLLDDNILAHKKMASHARIADISSKIRRLEQEVVKNTAIIASVSAEVTKEFDKFIPDITRKYVQDYNALIKAHESAPNNITRAKENIEKIQSIRGRVNEYASKKSYLMDIATLVKTIENESKALNSVEDGQSPAWIGSNHVLPDSIQPR